jgi:hypothetical protein
VSKNTKTTKPGQTQDADGGPRPTENGGGHSPGQAVISCTQYHDDSPVGPIHVTASVQVTELIEDEDGDRAFINVELSVEAEVLKTFWSLDFPAEVSTEVEKYRPEAIA